MTFIADPNPSTPPRKRHNGLTVRAYLGHCLWCRNGLYEGDDVVRGRGRWLGVLHRSCKDKTEETK